jgi:hypothetical protein
MRYHFFLSFLGAKFDPHDEYLKTSVHCFVFLSIRLFNSGVNEGVNNTPRGQSSLLGASFTSRWQIRQTSKSANLYSTNRLSALGRSILMLLKIAGWFLISLTPFFRRIFRWFSVSTTKGRTGWK